MAKKRKAAAPPDVADVADVAEDDLLGPAPAPPADDWIEVNVLVANVGTSIGKLYAGAVATLPAAEAQFLAARKQVRLT